MTQEHHRTRKLKENKWKIVLSQKLEDMNCVRAAWAGKIQRIGTEGKIVDYSTPAQEWPATQQVQAVANILC